MLLRCGCQITEEFADVNVGNRALERKYEVNIVQMHC